MTGAEELAVVSVDVMSDELVGQVSEEWENNLHSLW